MDALAAARRRFVARLAARFFVRFHMSLIFVGTLAAALLVSRLLLKAGVHLLMLRYALVVLGGYLVFFVLVRGWISYVTRLGVRGPRLGSRGPRRGSRRPRRGLLGRLLDILDVPGSSGGGGGSAGAPPFRAGGGRFGGGGASGSFDEPLADAGGGGGTGGGSVGSGASLDLDLDARAWILIPLLMLVAALVGAAISLAWQAPMILPEAAFEALLAAGLVKAARANAAHGWVRGVLRSTMIPFVLLLAGAIFLGWAVHHACPAAISLADVPRRCP